MKRPNKLLNKKYLSSLVIAAFLILSVLTAYNIQFGNNRQEKKDTDVTETMHAEIGMADRLHIICTTLEGLIRIKESG